MAAFKALKKERKLSKLPWLILSQLSKHIQKSHAKPTTHRNSHGQKSTSNPMSLLPKLRRNEPRCSQRHSHETLHVNPNRHGFLFCYTNLSYETRGFSPNPLPSSSDLPIWTHLMLRQVRSVRMGMLEKDAKKKERQKIERKKWYLTCDFSTLGFVACHVSFIGVKT